MNSPSDFTVTNETLSRSFSIMNNLSGDPPNSEVVSLAFTVMNSLPESPAPDEVLSRSFTVGNSDPTRLSDYEGISRSFTVGLKIESDYIVTEAISRASTVCNLINQGDIDGNGATDSSDISLFVGVLLGTDSDPIHRERSDFTCDGLADGQDIEPFVIAVTSH